MTRENESARAHGTVGRVRLVARGGGPRTYVGQTPPSTLFPFRDPPLAQENETGELTLRESGRDSLQDENVTGRGGDTCISSCSCLSGGGRVRPFALVQVPPLIESGR